MVLLESMEHSRTDDAKLEKAHGGSVALWELHREPSLSVAIRKAQVAGRGAQSRVGAAKRATAVAVESTRVAFSKAKRNASSSNTIAPNVWQIWAQ